MARLPTDIKIVQMNADEREYLTQQLDEPSEDFVLLANFLAKDGCDFPLQQAALMLRNTRGVAQKLIAQERARA